MRLTLLTLEQAQAVGQMLARLAEWWARVREQLASVARCIAETARHLARFTDQARPALQRPDRPVWVSPYGLAPKGPR